MRYFIILSFCRGSFDVEEYTKLVDDYFINLSSKINHHHEKEDEENKKEI